MTILEYCKESDLNDREQYYFDQLNPAYNIIKIARAGFHTYTHPDEIKAKISQTLKGVYTGEKAY